MWVAKSGYEWAEQHAERKDGKIVCKKTGEVLQALTTGRSIWFRPFRGGTGEVRSVVHPWCPGCGSEPNIRYGEPIYEDELVKTIPITN